MKKIFYFLGLPVSIYTLFTDDYESYFMNTQNCLDLYINKFDIYNLLEINFDKILQLSIYKEIEELKQISNQKKKEYFLLSRFQNKAANFFKESLVEYSKNSKNKNILKFSKIAELFMTANKEFKLDFSQTSEIFKNNFTFISEDYIEFETFMEFYNKNIKFSVKIFEFVKITFDVIMHLHKNIETKINIFLLNSKEYGNGYLLNKNFEHVICELIPSFEKKWKINEYFK